MPALDIYHNCVKNVLVKEGWAITNDPLRLRLGTKDMYVDLGAKQLFAAQLGKQKIAVEIKSFTGQSEIEDLKNALGKFVLYRAVLNKTEPERNLYLAVHDSTFNSLFCEPVGQLLLSTENINMIVFEPSNEVIVRWIS